MWQLFAFGAILGNAAESIIDKVIMIEHKRRDNTLAAFQRNLIYFLFVLILGLWGIFGPLHISLAWPVILMGVMATADSIGYSYILKHMEITGYAAFEHLFPFIFLLTDVFLFRTNITLLQIVGIILLGWGGLLFVIDLKRRRMRKMYNKITGLLILLSFSASGVEYYAFKHLHTSAGMNEVSFLTSVWIVVVLGLGLVATFQGSWHRLPKEMAQDNYFLKSILSKGLDAGSSLLWLHAIALVAVSRVTAMGSFSPLVLFIGAFTTQAIFRIKAEEKMDRRMILQKACATMLLCLGGWLAR